MSSCFHNLKSNQMFDTFGKSVWISSKSPYKDLKVINKNLDSFNCFYYYPNGNMYKNGINLFNK